MYKIVFAWNAINNYKTGDVLKCQNSILVLASLKQTIIFFLVFFFSLFYQFGAFLSPN